MRPVAQPIGKFEVRVAEARPTKTGSPVDLAFAIDDAKRVCIQSQLEYPDASVAYALEQLEVLEEAILRRWPLEPGVKGRIDLGPFAAKNILDLNPDLASLLMKIDYALRHNLASIDAEPVAAKTEMLGQAQALAAKLNT